MKKLIPLLLAVIAGVVMSDEPGEAFENLVDAFYEGDVCGVEAGLSSNSINMLNMMLMMVKLQPDQAAAEISQEFQIAVTGEDLMNWSTTDFIDAFINAPGIKDEFPPREDLEITGCEIHGDSSIVFLKVFDYPEAVEIAMIREGDDWKLCEGLVQSEL